MPTSNNCPAPRTLKYYAGENRRTAPAYRTPIPDGITGNLVENRQETAGANMLLNSLGRGVTANEVFENGQDMTAVFDDAFEHRAKVRLALRLAVPFGEHRGGYADVAAELFGLVATQKEAIKKRGFALWELEILQDLFNRIGLRSHIEKGSLQISPLPSSVRTGIFK
jgi:hypothetical protein